jgi:Mycothiol maleylpyruvate isomerase N-terminal domain
VRTRDEQIAAIRADQQFWRDLAAEVGPARYAEPGPMGEWSFGDMAGHLLGWRDRTLNRLEAFARGEPDPPNPWPAELNEDDEVDAINAWIQDHHADRSPTQLVADYDASYDRLVRAIESIPEAKLIDPTAIPFAGGPLVDVDFGGHLHDEHVPSVRAWLAELDDRPIAAWTGPTSS